MKTKKYAVVFSDEMTNLESRVFFYNLEDQDEIFNVIDNNSHLLIWQ